MISPSATLLTGEGIGAVAVVRVAGPGALEAVNAAWRSATGRRLDAKAFDQPCFGRIGRGVGDEVVVVASADEVEIHCHGGPAAIELVFQALGEVGANNVAEMPRCRLQVEANEELTLATTLRTASHLLDQANGALERSLDNILRLIQQESPEALTQIDSLIDTAKVGMRLRVGWRLALAGRPNVGKSRLLNALAGFDRSIVSGSAGTTRDFVSLRTAFNGWPVEVLDTAGLRESSDPLESAGIALARTVQAEADLILLVLDQSQPLTDEDSELIKAYSDPLIVRNKSDLPPVWTSDAVAVSAERGDGIAELVDLIGRTLVPKSPEEGSPLIFLAGQLRKLRAIRAGLLKGERGRSLRVLRRWLGKVAE